MPAAASANDDDADPAAPDFLPSAGLSRSVAYSTRVPMHMYPFPHSLVSAHKAARSKRRQVKIACSNCQKACKKCDDARPCMRCVKYGISDDCVDSRRKERKKGGRRGPYKKRDIQDRAGSTSEHLESDVLPVPKGGGELANESSSSTASPLQTLSDSASSVQYTAAPYCGPYYPHAIYQPSFVATTTTKPSAGGPAPYSNMQYYYPPHSMTGFNQSRANTGPVYYPPYLDPGYGGASPAAHPYYAYYHHPRPRALVSERPEIA